MSSVKSFDSIELDYELQEWKLLSLWEIYITNCFKNYIIDQQQMTGGKEIELTSMCIRNTEFKKLCKLLPW